MSANELRSLIGDIIPFNYTIDDVEYSGSFVYASSMDFQLASSVLGYNVSDNPVFGSTKLPNYEGLYYYWISDFTSATSLYNVDIRLNMTFSGGARGGFMAGGLGSASPSNMTTALNAISNGGNYIGGVGNSSIITGNIQADSSLADYYGIVSTSTNPSPGDTFRPLVYDSTNFNINHVFYNRIRTFNLPSIGKQVLGLYVIAPYKYGDVTASVIDTTTTTTATTSANYADVVSGIDELNTGINELNTGVSELNSGMDELNTGVSELHSDVLDIGSNIVSALLVPDETLASMNLDPLDTLPDLNYNQVIDDADDVLEDIPSGIVGAASMWAMLDLLFGVDSAFLWIIPLAIFMCIACWVIWRK